MGKLKEIMADYFAIFFIVLIFTSAFLFCVLQMRENDNYADNYITERTKEFQKEQKEIDEKMAITKEELSKLEDMNDYISR